MNAWLVEDVDTGLVDGYYMSLDLATDMMLYFKDQFPQLNLIVRQQITPHCLQDCELLTESDWFKCLK